MEGKRDESWLRNWLRHGWDDEERGPIGWIEPGRGGTVGLPDCLLPANGLWIPCELKATISPYVSYKFNTRGPQYRFHMMAARAGYLTFYLVVCSDSIMAFPFVDTLEIGRSVRGAPIVSTHQLLLTLRKKEFWAMQPVRRPRKP